MSRAATFATVLADRGAARLLAAAAISAYGDWVYVIALGGLLVPKGGIAAVALSSTALHAVALMGAPLGGWLADRVSRRAVMIATDLLRALVMATLAATSSSLPATIALVVLSAASGTVFRVARASVVPDAVPAERRAALNALLSSVSASAVIGGPALGALLATAGLDAKGLFLLNAASFLASAALLGGLRVGRGGPVSRPPRAREGVRALIADSARISWTSLSALLHVGAGATFVALPLAAVDADGGGAARLGTAFALLGLGIAVGGLAGAQGGRDPLRRRVALAVALTGPLLAAACAAGWPWLLVACFALGAASSVADVPLTTALQALVPAHARGAAFSALDALGTLGMLAGAAALGALASATDLGTASAIVGGAVASGALLAGTGGGRVVARA